MGDSASISPFPIAHRRRHGIQVIASTFRINESDFRYEQEALTPLGVTIQPVVADSDEAFVAQARDADVILSGARQLNANIINRLEKTRPITNPGVGVDRVDLDAATAQGIVVTNVPDVFIDEVANHAMMLLLC